MLKSEKKCACENNYLKYEETYEFHKYVKILLIHDFLIYVDPFFNNKAIWYIVHI